MKNIFLLSIIYLFVSCAEKKSVLIDNSIISQIRNSKAKTQLILKSVTNDSRCPEGTNCIWAGDVTIEIQVIENLKILETKALVISSKNQIENIAWLSKYYPNQKINAIQVLPYPKSEVVINPEEYYIKILSK